MNDDNKYTQVIIQDQRSSAVGIASFIIGMFSIFVLSPVFVPIAIVLGVIGIIKDQMLWSILGLITAAIGFFTSPILLGLFGLVSLGSIS